MPWGSEHNIACWSLQSQLLGLKGPHVAGLLHGQQPQAVFACPAEPRVLQHSSCGDVLLCSRQHTPALSTLGRLQDGVLHSRWQPGQDLVTAVSSNGTADGRVWAHLPSWQHTQDVTWSPDGSQLGLLQVKGATLVDWERKCPVATLHTSGCGTLRFLHSSSGNSGSNISGASRLVLMRPGELLLWDVRSSPTRSSSTQRLQVAHPKTRLTCCEVLPGTDMAAVAAEGGQVQLWDLRKAGGVKSLGACGAHQGQVICTLPLTRPPHQRQRQQQLVSPATGQPPGTLQVGQANPAGARVEAAELLLNPVAQHLLGVVGHTEVCLLDLLTGHVVEIVSLINAVLPSSGEAPPTTGQQQQQQQQQASGRPQPPPPRSIGAADPVTSGATSTADPRSSTPDTSSQAQQDQLGQYRLQRVPVAPCQQSCWDAAGIVLWTQGLEALPDPGSPEGGLVLPTLAQVHFSSAGGRSGSSSSSMRVMAAQLADDRTAGVDASAVAAGSMGTAAERGELASHPSNGFTTAAAVLERGDASQQQGDTLVSASSNICGMPTVVHRLVGGCPVVFSAHPASGSMMVATFDGRLQWW